MDIDYAKFIFNRVDSGKYAGMYTISNVGSKWYLMKYYNSNDHSGNPWFRGSNSLVESSDDSYWDLTKNADGTWTIQATLHAYPDYAILYFLTASSSGLGYPIIMPTHSGNRGIKLFPADKVQAIED